MKFSVSIHEEEYSMREKAKILREVFRGFQDKYLERANDFPEEIEKVWRYIIHHLFDQELSVSNLKEIHNSYRNNHFSAHFAEVFKLTPLQYINSLRVEASKLILLDPRFHNIRISILAKELGYSDPTTFTNAFKRINRISPSKWRKLNLGQS